MIPRTLWHGTRTALPKDAGLGLDMLRISRTISRLKFNERTI